MRERMVGQGGLWDALKRLHADERGAEGLEKLLIIAVIVLPLLGILIFAKNAIIAWVTGKWNEITGISDDETGAFDSPSN